MAENKADEERKAVLASKMDVTRTIHEVVEKDKYEEVKNSIVGCGVDAKTATRLLDNLKFNNYSLDQSTYTKMIDEIKKLGVNEVSLSNLDILLRIELNGELICESDTMCMILLTTLKTRGLSNKIYNGCFELLNAKEGQSLDYNPIPDLIAYACAPRNRRIKELWTIALSCAQYLNGGEDELDLQPAI